MSGTSACSSRVDAVDVAVGVGVPLCVADDDAEAVCDFDDVADGDGFAYCEAVEDCNAVVVAVAVAEAVGVTGAAISRMR